MFLEQSSDGAQARDDVRFLEQRLARVRIADECSGDEVREPSAIAKFIEPLRELIAEFLGNLEARGECPHFIRDTRGGATGGRDVVQLLNAGHAERRVLCEGREAHTEEPLDHEIRRAIAVRDRRAYESEPRRVVKLPGALRLGDAGLHHRDAEHAIMFERPLQHLAVARLEDAQRHDCLGEEHPAGEHHDRDFRRELEFFVVCHGACVLRCNVPSGGMTEKEKSRTFTLVTVASGARSLRSIEHGETFHPVVGPMAEARSLHVAQSRLVQRAENCGRPLVVWDVGLGAAANAIAVIEAFQTAGGGCTVEMHSFDHTTAPLEFARDHASELGYPMPWIREIDSLLAEGSVAAGRVAWRLHRADFREFVRSPAAPRPDAILYDPYSPSANPGMWTLGHFTQLRTCLDPARPCTLTSYSRSTAVRVTMVLAGFFVGRGGATGEKDETTLAATDRGLIAQPLDARWLEKVRRSTRGGPLREGCESGPVSDEDFAALTVLLRGAV